MFARVATFEGGDRDRLSDLNEERMRDGTMNPPDGVRSLLVLEDRDADRHLFLTFFETREAIDAAEARFEQMGEEIPEELRGRRTGLDVYEVALSLDMVDPSTSTVRA